MVTAKPCQQGEAGGGMDDFEVNNPLQLSHEGSVRNHLIFWTPRYFCFMNLLGVELSLLAHSWHVSVNIIRSSDGFFLLSSLMWIYVILLLEYHFVRVFDEEINA